MQRIFKYPIPVDDDFMLYLPKGAKILTVQTQDDKPYIWAEINDEAIENKHYFALRGTGHPLKEEGMKYIGTFQMIKGRVVFHLYDKGEVYE